MGTQNSSGDAHKLTIAPPWGSACQAAPRASPHSSRTAYSPGVQASHALQQASRVAYSASGVRFLAGSARGSAPHFGSSRSRPSFPVKGSGGIGWTRSLRCYRKGGYTAGGQCGRKAIGGQHGGQRLGLHGIGRSKGVAGIGGAAKHHAVYGGSLHAAEQHLRFGRMGRVQICDCDQNFPIGGAAGADMQRGYSLIVMAQDGCLCVAFQLLCA